MKLHVNQNILLTGKTSTTIINDSLSNKTMRRSFTSHLKNKHFRVFFKDTQQLFTTCIQT